MKKLNLALALLLFSTVAAFAQSTPNPKAGAAGSEDTRNPIPAGENTYESIRMDIGTSFDADIVRESLLNLKGWIQPKGYDLALQHEKESPFAFHYAYDQTYAGLPIYQHGIKATVSKQGQLVNVLNTLEAEVTASAPEFRLEESQVKTHFEREYGTGMEGFEIKACYYVNGTELVPAFEVHYPYGESMWEEVLDGRDLTQYRRRDLGSFHHQLFMADTNGTALVFNPDPLTTSGNTYGATSDWQDNNDADNNSLNGERVRVTLQDIDYTGGIFRLVGPYVDLQDLESPTEPVVTTTDGVFDFTRSQSGFEDVMCYYHIDNYQRYLQSIGFNNLYASPLLVDPHGLSGQDNSHFVPSGTSSRLAFGEGCVDDAEDADVIVHEYGHALSFSAAPGTNSGTERLGLDEGIGDYIAASYSRSLSFNLWKNTFTWDGHNTCWDGRSASDPTAYPPNTFNIYVYGAIWASCLMEVFDQVGREASDRVFFQSLYSNYGSMTLTDAANVVLDAELLVYGGANASIYQSVFCSRGILTGAACIVSRPDPNSLEPTWHLFPNPTSDQFTLQLEDYVPGTDYGYRVADLMGRVLVQGDLTSGPESLEAGNWGAGVYLVEIMADGQPVAQRKLVVRR